MWVHTDWYQPIDMNGERLEVRWTPFDSRAVDPTFLQQPSLPHPHCSTPRAIHEYDGCVLVYSGHSRGGFDQLKHAWEALNREHETTTPSHALLHRLWVVANMIDLPVEQQAVELQEGRRWADAIKGIFKPMSARTGEGTEGFAQEIALCALGKTSGS